MQARAYASSPRQTPRERRQFLSAILAEALEISRDLDELLEPVLRSAENEDKKQEDDKNKDESGSSLQ